MLVIPPDALEQTTLLAVIDAFVLREGTDYGHSEFSLEEKRASVMALLQNGKAEIHYYPESDFIDIQRT